MSARGARGAVQPCEKGCWEAFYAEGQGWLRSGRQGKARRGLRFISVSALQNVCVQVYTHIYTYTQYEYHNFTSGAQIVAFVAQW